MVKSWRLEENFWRGEDLFEEAFGLRHNHTISGPGEQEIALTSNLVRELQGNNPRKNLLERAVGGAGPSTHTEEKQLH